MRGKGVLEADDGDNGANHVLETFDLGMFGDRGSKDLHVDVIEWSLIVICQYSLRQNH
jgi:hypothetical protein